MFPISVDRHSMVPTPFLNANKFSDKKELDSSHQSSLHFNIYLKTLHIEEDRAIGRNEVLEFGLGMGMTR